MEAIFDYSKIENRETFFKRIACLFPTLDPRYKAINHAYSQAKAAFNGKKRENGEKYFEHLRAVAIIIIDYLRIRDHEIIIAALLHDIVEDIPQWTIERVQREYGERVALLVEWLTKPPTSEFSSQEARNDYYYKKIAQAPRDFWLIKLPDRLHNLMTLWDCSEEKIERKIKETKRYFLRVSEKEIILIHELEEAIMRLEVSKKK